MLRSLVDMGIRSILVVDADPASNLLEVLGMKVHRTGGDVTNELKKVIDSGELPPLTL